jgi:2-methylcitrate dehydratase PrpD
MEPDLMPTIIEQLSGFTAGCRADTLPPEVAHETKRLLLDSIGCGLAATAEPKGRIGLQTAALIGQGDVATVLGTGSKSSVFGAAFANGELINALDYDAILPPGHVSPYVIPGALATAEAVGASGADLLAALALAHEMSYRIGKAMDYLRDISEGRMDTPQVYGYASTIFGATAAIMRVRGLDAGVIAQGLGIAGCISPVNSHMAWVRHAPATTIKYTVAGVMAQSALTAAAMGEYGHRGDIQVLDDPRYGFPAMVGTKRWMPEGITDGLGAVWRYIHESSLKPYPHCRVLHNVFDVLIEVLTRHDIRPEEIESIRVQGEAFVELPIWLNDRIEHVQDAQFSLKHGIALAAQRVPPGKAWQDPALVYNDAVMSLMARVTHEPHPDYIPFLKEHPSSRPARVEIRTRGGIFSGEKRFPKGSPSPDLASYMTDAELIAKFRGNSEGVLPTATMDEAVDRLMMLETVPDVAGLMALFRSPAGDGQ